MKLTEDVRSMLRSHQAVTGLTSETDDDATGAEYLHMALDDIDELMQVVTAASAWYEYALSHPAEVSAWRNFTEILFEIKYGRCPNRTD